MKKDIKRKRVNNTRTSKYKPSKNIKKRVNTKGKYNTKSFTPTRTRTKTKNSIKLAFLIVFIVLVLFAKIKVGTIAALIIGVLLAILYLFIWLLKRASKKGRRRIITIFIILILLFGIACIGAFTAFLFYIQSISDPIYKEKKADLNTKETTTLYDKDGFEFAKLGSEMREKVTYDQLPEVLVDAIIATEDSRFFQHNGFDAPRFVKASIGQVTGNSGAGGASTLSMQVVKNVFTDAKQDSGIEGIIRKFQDIYLAVFKLEKEYTKEQIIEFYVNNHFLGGNMYGVEEASQFYFGKSASQLNLSEGAIIAGMFKSPTYYRPDTHPENAEARRKTVLYLMRRHGYITEEEQKLANSIPVSSLVTPNEVQEQPYQGYIDTVVAEIRQKYKVNAYTTSLKVYTMLDRSRQDAVDRVLSGEAYEWIDDKVQTGVAVLESDTGAIIAIGAGRHRTGINSYNFATQIKRQPGSTAKPLFDYGPGMEYNDWSTYTLFDDAPYTYSGGRSIKNWDGGYYGVITLRRALSTSRNIPALKAFQQVENKKIVEFVTSLGIEPEIDDGRIHEAHAIGAFTGVSPLQMAGAYSAFSNGGYYNEPYSVSKMIYRSTGETVEHESNKTQVMSDSTAFMIASVLKDVSLTGGTPRYLACKTGTTNYSDETMDKYHMPYDAIRDSWVVGFTTKTTMAMWYGYDELNQEMVDNGYVLHNVPATIQKDRLYNALVAQGAIEGDRSDFVQPSSVVRIGVANGTNPPKLAGPGTEAIYEYFKAGTEPTETEIGQANIDGPSGLKASYSDKTKKVTLSWRSVSPGEFANDSYGTWGYNVYLNDKLLTWTDKTTYVSAENQFGTYKIIATYKGYSGIQSNPSEITVEKPKEKPKPKEDEDNTENPDNTNNTNNTDNTKPDNSSSTETP